MRGTAALAAGLLSLAAAATAAPEPQLALLEDGQGLSGASRRSNAVAVSPDARHVYAVSPGYTIALRRDDDGGLSFVEEYPLNAPGSAVTVPADGLGVLALASLPGAASIVSYRREPADGRLSFVENESQNLGPAAFAIVASRDGARVYATSPGQDAVVAYARDAATGALTFAQRVLESDAGVSGLVDANHLAASPDDRHLYVAGFVDAGDGDFPAAIVVLRREPDGSLAFVEAVQTGLEDLASTLLAGLAVAPDGAEVLALDGGSLAVEGAALLRYARDPADGRLSFVARVPLAAPGLFDGTATWLALRPDGRRLFFGGLSLAPTAGLVLAYGRDPAGALAPLAAVDVAVVTNHGVASPDGRFVYTDLAQGVRVLVPAPGAAGAALAAAATLLALSRRARPAPPRVRASAPA